MSGANPLAAALPLSHNGHQRRGPDKTAISITPRGARDFQIILPQGGGGHHQLYCNAGTTRGGAEASFGHPPPFKNQINTCIPYRDNPGVNLDRTDTTL